MVQSLVHYQSIGYYTLGALMICIINSVHSILCKVKKTKPLKKVSFLIKSGIYGIAAAFSNILLREFLIGKLSL